MAEAYHCGQIGRIRRLMGRPVAEVNDLNRHR